MPDSIYTPDPTRYTDKKMNRLGKSGLCLSPLSLGLWHNFGAIDDFSEAQKIIFKAFDSGITHFDLANNYGPPPGSAEITFGKILKDDLKNHRDEMLITTKAGWEMWAGPYGNFGSRKYLLASLDQSLKRMGLDYVDIFYHHRPDPSTPLEESIGALATAVQNGKALYVGISSYSAQETLTALQVFKQLGIPCLVHQMRYNLFSQELHTSGLDQVLVDNGVGGVCFSTLAQGILTGKYLNGIPENSRAARPDGYLKPELISAKQLEIVKKLTQIAQNRNQGLSEMAIAWTLQNPAVQSAIIGPRTLEQLNQNLKALDCLDFSSEELAQIQQICAG